MGSMEVGVTSLWLPILLSAVAVFILSSVIHMFVKYHNSDYAKLPGEESIRAAIKAANVVPGQYSFPRPDDPKLVGGKEHMAMMKDGPGGFMVVMDGAGNMAKNLVMWFLFCVLIGVFAAYVAGRALGPGAPYLSAFRFTGTVAIVGYALGQIPNSIWYGGSWSATAKNLLDGVLYGLVTAGIFGWLWP